MQKQRVTNGVYWVEIPEADLFILCGCPADSVKHLMKMGLIVEREKDGVMAQTGPNAILLSDTTIQNGSFSNLAEFPVLQMLYLQGMILPGHPNNTGRKPMLIGLEDQVKSQSSYIYRGTYGLASLAEIIEAGVTGEPGAGHAADQAVVRLRQHPPHRGPPGPADRGLPRRGAARGRVRAAARLQPLRVHPRR